MQRKVRTIIFGLCILFYTPFKGYALGLDFKEKVYFYKEGSGLFSFKVDLSKSKFFIGLMKYLKHDYNTLDKFIGYNIFKTTKKNLKSVPGIKNVSIINDAKLLSFIIQFEFDSINALNKAMDQINQNIHPDIKLNYFRFEDEIFVREDINGIVKKLIHYQAYDPSLIKSIELSSFFKGMTYTTVYTFPRKIKQASNPCSEISKDKKSIRVMHHILSPDQVKDSISNRIHFQQ